MKRFSPALNNIQAVERPLPDKELLWGDQDGGCNRFPKELKAISDRVHSSDPLPLRAFGHAVSRAQERVWMVDEYLLVPKKYSTPLSRVQHILEWMPFTLAAYDIRFLTKHHQEVDNTLLKRLEDHAQDINDYQTPRAIQCSIQVRTHLTQKFDFIHDRFAIIDDELWHFGGTVGGFHPSVSAASRGWRASEHGAIDFFNMAWNEGAEK